MGKHHRPKRKPPLTFPTDADYERMAALRECGGCSGRGTQQIRIENVSRVIVAPTNKWKEFEIGLKDGERNIAVLVRCLECEGTGSIER